MLLKDKNERKFPFWVSYVRRRIRLKKNFLGFISGSTGSGKSWAGLSCCYMIDPEFNSERIITSMKQLMDLINSGKLKTGSAILWDEAGIDISSKNWQSVTNKLINYLFQTFRHKRFVLIFTSPYMDYIDASTRKLFHAEFQTVSIDYEAKTTKLKCQLIQYNSRMRKFYYKYMRIIRKNGRIAVLKHWNVPAPPKWLIDQYEVIKNEFTRDLNLDISKQINKLNQKEVLIQKELTKKQENILILMAKHNNIAKVVQESGISQPTVYFHIQQARKKGWKPDDFKQL